MAEFNLFNKEESQQRFCLREEKLRVLQEEKDARVALIRRQQQALDEQQKAVDLEFMMKDHTIYQEPMLQLILYLVTSPMVVALVVAGLAVGMIVVASKHDTDLNIRQITYNLSLA
ncbi:hypothetical protein E3N88_26508 [Mikania micrantha]|uniref:Uncharacterized protein n=1 Tax=Mikania micrantha TaxID=192012 RepID=A0A5N6N7R9_9ASTR|nr:hypothetical protein E3N88_26508 [Mikania micrantha]